MSASTVDLDEDFAAAVEHRPRRIETLTGPMQQALGALSAQQVVDQQATAIASWHVCIELAARFGFKSPAVKAFVCELTKRATRSGS